MTVEQEIQDLQLFGFALREENRKIFESDVGVRARYYADAGPGKRPFRSDSHVIDFQAAKDDQYVVTRNGKTIYSFPDY